MKLTEKVLQTKNISQTHYLNIARVVACFAVAMLHIICTPVSFCQNSYSATELFFVRLVRNSLAWCVPVFVMISGVLFLNTEKEVPLKKIFQKYIRRFFLVILIFGTTYTLMEIVFTEKTFSLVQIPKALLATCLGKTWDHMWYLYMAIGIYMFIPALKIFVANIEDKILFYTLLVLFLFSSIVPYIAIFLNFKNSFPSISIYIFYLLFGYAIHYKKLELRILPSILILIAFLLYLAIIQTNDFFVIENNASLKSVGYDSPLVVLSAWAVFSLCKKVTKELRFIEWLSPLTFGIYIIHPVPIHLCYKILHITVEKYALISSFCIVTVIVLLTSILGTIILRTIPFVKKYIL